MTRVAFARRLLVALNGHDPDVHLIRYASMVARLGQRWGGEATEGPPSPAWSPHATHRGSDPEVRFVYLFPPKKAACCGPPPVPPRGALRAQVNSYFTLPSACFLACGDEADRGANMAVGYDVLKEGALDRLSVLAADFDSDLLLGQAAWSPAACARIALETPCPVWLVPPGSAPVLRRLLVACDFSDRSAHVLRAAIEIARGSQHAKCFVLHVYWTGSRFSDDWMRREELRRRHQAYERFVSRIDTHGVAVEPLFVEGHRVDHQIDQAARGRRVDLVVASSRGRTRFARWLLPSIADLAIRRCRAAFLVLRTSQRPVGLLSGLRERLNTPADVHFA
jgi:nucleotide-binding universal stress UspA family protein